MRGRPERGGELRRVTSELDLLILGPVPPPFGGVAVHIHRLVPLLQKAGLEVGVLNHFSSTEASFVIGALKRSPLNYFRLPKKVAARIVHYHHSHWLALLAVVLAKRRRSSYIITLHSGGLARHLRSNVPLRKWMTQWALNSFDLIIVVNQEIRAAVEPYVDARRIEVVPAFVSATHEGARPDLGSGRFLASGRTLLVAAYRLRVRKDGGEPYGLDTAVEAFVTLAHEQSHLKLAFFIAERPAGRKAKHYLSSLNTRLEQAGLADRVLTVFGRPLVSAFGHDVILVRPTRSDGDSLSVREALQAGVPVIASDVVQRPSGTITFPHDDVHALCEAVRKVLDEATERSQPSARGMDDVASDAILAHLIRIYRGQLVEAEGATPRTSSRTDSSG